MLNVWDTHHRKREFKKRNSGTLIRLYCGLEDIDDQKKDIKNALKNLN